MLTRVIGIFVALAGLAFAAVRFAAVDATTLESLITSIVFGGALAGGVVTFLGVNAAIVGPHPDAGVRSKNRRAGLAGVLLGAGLLGAEEFVRRFVLLDGHVLVLLVLGLVGLMLGSSMLVTGRAPNET